MNDDVARRILQNNAYATVSTVCADGAPWGVPVHFAYDESRVFWLSADTTQHSQNIAREPRVFVTIFDSRQTVAEPADRGAVYIATTARKLTGDDELYAREVYADRFPDDDDRRVGADAIGIYAAPLGVCDEEKSDAGRRYYVAHDEGATA